MEKLTKKLCLLETVLKMTDVFEVKGLLEFCKMKLKRAFEAFYIETMEKSGSFDTEYTALNSAETIFALE